MLHIKKLVFGCIGEILLSSGLLSICAIFLQKAGTLLTSGTAATISALIGIISILVTSILTAQWAGEKGFLHGTALSLIYTFIYVAVSLGIFASENTVLLVVRSVIFILCGTIGGIIGVSLKSNKARF